MSVVSIESYNNVFLHRFACFDELESNTVLFSPLRQGQRDELWTVVCSELEGIAADSGYPFKLAHHSLGGKTEVNFDHQRFAIEVIDHIESPEASSIPQRIAHEVC